METKPAEKLKMALALASKAASETERELMSLRDALAGCRARAERLEALLSAHGINHE